MLSGIEINPRGQLVSYIYLLQGQLIAKQDITQCYKKCWNGLPNAT